jgi:hypothetical protein
MFYNREPDIPDDVAAIIHLWHQAGGELVGVVYPDGSGQVHLFIHPGFRDLEQDMFEWAESHPARQVGDETYTLVTFVYEYDLA